MNVIIPMAGHGSRMNSPIPKYMMIAGGKSVLELVIESLDLPTANYYFVISDSDYLKESDISSWLTAKFRHLYPTIIPLKDTPNGSALSAYTAIPYMDLDQPLVIADCDNAFTWNPEDAGNNCILLHDSTDPKYSYVELDYRDNIVDIVEKQVIGSNAVAGVYSWSSTADFAHFTQQSMIDQNVTDKELYMSTVIRTSMQKNQYYSAWARNYHCLGTQQDLIEYNKLGHEVRS